MAFSSINTSIFAALKAVEKQFFELVSSNFTDHQARLNALEVTSNPFPTASIVKYSDTTIPPLFLLCDGSAISRTTFSDLFSELGVAFGAGDGSTTFNLPDYRDCIEMGAGAGPTLTARSLGDSVGANTHTLTTAEMPGHAHSVNDSGHVHGLTGGPTGGGASPGVFNTNGLFDQGTSESTTGISVNSNAGGQAHNNMQPYLCVRFLIRV